MPPLFILTLKFRLQGCSSLKEKRSRMASFLAKLKKRTFQLLNLISLNQHQESEITIAKLSINNSA